MSGRIKIWLSKRTEARMPRDLILRYYALKGVELTTYVIQMLEYRWRWVRWDEYQRTLDVRIFPEAREYTTKDVGAYPDSEKVKEYAIPPLHLVERTDPLFIQAIEELGTKAHPYTIIEIPDDIEWYIDEHPYDDGECVMEAHRMWTVEGEEYYDGGAE